MFDKHSLTWSNCRKTGQKNKKENIYWNKYYWVSCNQ